MKKTLFFGKIVMLTCLSFATVAKAELYKVTGVAVEAESVSSLAAKEIALATGQLTAFNRLMAKLAPENMENLPAQNEESVLDFVQGVSIENEKTTATKYMGSIAVEFNEKAVQDFLNSAKVTYLKNEAPALLVVPVFVQNGQKAVLDEMNPLYIALKEKGDFAPFFKAAVPAGDMEEMNLAAMAAAQEDFSGFQSLLPVYDKKRVMVLYLTPESEDVWQIYNAFYPAAGMENQVVHKRFRFAYGDKQVAAEKMAEAVFSEMESRWRDEKTSSLSEDKTLYLRIKAESLPEWLQLEKEMKKWELFETFSLKGLYLPQVLVEAKYKGAEYQLEEKLKEQGWRLEKDFRGNGATLTKVNQYE